MFWNRSTTDDETAAPIYVPRASVLPPRIERGHYPGPDWALWNGFNQNIGVVGKAALGAWTIKTGLFHSLNRSRSSFSNIFDGIDEAGEADRIVYADPPSRSRSYSGEFRASRAFAEGGRRHLVLLSLRGRDVVETWGGSDRADLGRVPIGEIVNPAKPAFRFSEQTRDGVKHLTGGLSYTLAWGEFLTYSAGVQRTHYKKSVHAPEQAAKDRKTDKWLPSTALTVRLAPDWVAYGSYTKGLEENGQAPDYAANRLEVLPALLTRQYDAGIKWSPFPSTSLIAGYFDIRKPYFSLDQNNVYRDLGEVSHSGFEVSVSDHSLPGLKVVGGAFLQRPRVSYAPGAAAAGRRPVGQPQVSLEMNVDYRLPFCEGLSVDGSVLHTGKVAATVRNDLFIPGYTTLSLGARYAFDLGRAPASLRVSVANVTNKYTWLSVGSGAFEPLDPRAVTAYLTVDL